MTPGTPRPRRALTQLGVVGILITVALVAAALLPVAAYSGSPGPAPTPDGLTLLLAFGAGAFTAAWITAAWIVLHHRPARRRPEIGEAR